MFKIHVWWCISSQKHKQVKKYSSCRKKYTNANRQLLIAVCKYNLLACINSILRTSGWIFNKVVPFSDFLFIIPSGIVIVLPLVSSFLFKVFSCVGESFCTTKNYPGSISTDTSPPYNKSNVMYFKHHNNRFKM